MTNYERIKQMSVEDMAKFMDDIYHMDCDFCVIDRYPCTFDKKTCCIDGHKNWLESEVKNYVEEEEWV